MIDRTLFRGPLLVPRAPVLALVLLCGCGAEEPEAHTFGGAPLFAQPLDAATRAEREAQLAAARAELAARPDDPDALIWVGRRTAYLGRFREAVEVFTQGHERHPGDARFLRHRGHRHITLRQLDAAIADLERAAAMLAGQPDEVEPDGLPNARNIPTGTLHFNVWYHLGLAHYLSGRLDDAAASYARCLEVSRNPDTLCATTHWAHVTLRRLGRADEARALLAPIRADLDVIENHGYHQLCLMYKGERSPEDVLGAGGEEGTVEDATVSYGVARWLLDQDRAEAGRALLARIVQGPQWPAFGHIAAEAER